MALTTDGLIDAIQRYADAIAEHRKLLIDLDRAIGDGDHGENMHRGFKAVAEQLEEQRGEQPADVLTFVAKTLVSKVGGAAGPLYGTAFLRAAKAAGDADELDAAGVLDVLAAGLEGVQQRGKAEPGDKTMVDAWEPAVEAGRQALDGGSDLDDVLRAAADAAAQGMRDTIPLEAHKGRASYLGERSKDHQDPGATSTYLLFAALAGRDVSAQELSDK